MKIKRRANAKINLTLDILGVEDNFHTLKSLVGEIDLADTIIIKKRKDKKITLKILGANLPCDQTNNAYKAAKAFMQKFNTCGVDIVVKKKIPIGGGLGGSSADIAGVLNIMKELFNVSESVDEIASKLGSDVNYMLNGGYALLEGRGERVTKINSNLELFLILLPNKKSLTARECYQAFDKRNKFYPQKSDLAVKYIENGDFEGLKKCLKNDLYVSAKVLIPEIGENLKAINTFENAVMTGSGSTVYAIFNNRKQRDKEFRRLKKHHNLIKAKTIIR